MKGVRAKSTRLALAPVAAACAFGTLGCGETAIILPIPERAGTHSVVLVLRVEGSPALLRVEAMDPAGGRIVTEAPRTEDRLQAFALLHDETLAALELTEGAIPLGDPAPADGELDPIFSDADESWTAALAADAEARWERAEPLDPGIARLRRPLPALPPGCARIELEWTRTVPNVGEPSFAFVLPDGRALIAYHPRLDQPYGLVVIDAEGTVTAVPLPVPLPPLVAALQTSPGEWILGGDDRRLWRGRWDGTRLVATPLGPPQPGAGAIDLIDGAVTSTSFEVYTWNRSGAVEAWREDGSARMLGQISPTRGYKDGGLARLGPEDILLADPQSRELLHIRGSTVSREVAGFNDGVIRLRRLASRVAAGTYLGGLGWRDGAGTWRIADPPASNTSINAFGDTSDGFLWGGTRAWFGQYVDQLGYCPKQLLGSSAAQEIVRWGPDTYLMVFNHPTGSVASVARVHLRSETR